MNSRTLPQSLKDNADATLNLGNELLNSAGQAFEQTRDLASKGLEAAAEASARAQKQLSRYADVTGRYVADQPLRSVLAAAAVGAVLAAVVIAARRNR